MARRPPDLSRLKRWAGHRPLTILELGLRDAEAAAWMLSEIATAPDEQYIGVGDWRDAAEEDRARRRLAPWSERVRLFCCQHGPLAVMRHPPPGMLQALAPGADLVYCRGREPDPYPMLASLVAVWPHLNIDGWLLVENYRRRRGADHSRAADAFLAALNGKVKILWADSQLAIQRIAA